MNYYFLFCLNMRTKTNKILQKKSKLKMSSLSNGGSSKASISPKKSKDVPRKKCEAVADISDTTVKSTKCRDCSKKEGTSKESIDCAIKCDAMQTSENSVANSCKIDPHPNFHSPVRTLFTNYGFFSIPMYNNHLVFRCLGNPLYPQYYPQFRLSNYSYTNSVCRSASTTWQSDKYNNSDVERDRKLLFNWRTWQRTSYGKTCDQGSEKDRAFTFTIMSYNVLAQELLSNHTNLYKYHNPNALSWERRWSNLLFEIKQQNPDIICFQEVQATHVQIYYKELEALGYDGIYKERTGNSTVDGCAIFYKTCALKLVNYITVEYFQPNIFVLNRDNVAIIAKFAPKQNIENEFIVSTTHLLYNPRREDVRLAQTQVLLTEIDRMAFKRISKTESIHIPIIITGDFNFKPNSPAYNLITKGKLKYENLSNKSLMTMQPNNTRDNKTGKFLLPSTLGITDQCQHVDLAHQRNKHNKIEESEYIYLFHSERNSNYNESKHFNGALFSSGVLSHHLAIKSAYSHRRGSDIEATTFQDQWVTVDYIFYSGSKDSNGLVVEDKLKLLSRYTMPTSNDLQGVHIPNMAVGSDHFSLVVKFKLNP